MNANLKSEPHQTREIIGVLMESAFYFDLSLLERLELVKHILNSSDLATVH